LELIGYAGLIAFDELTAALGPQTTEWFLERFPGDPRTVGVLLESPVEILTAAENIDAILGQVAGGLDLIGTLGNVVLHLTLALAFAFFLLRDGPRLSAWFRSSVASSDSVADTYLSGVDADLQTVYFGNVLTVVAVGMLSVGVYHGFNFVSPRPLQIPFPTLLAILTGFATFVPLVVGKLIYLPVTATLGWSAIHSGRPDVLPWVAGFLILSFLLLDLIPQTFVRPYVAGRSIHSGMILFSYILGTAMFGWYGLFLGPFLIVCVVQAANVVLPELLHGEKLTRSSEIDIGTDPKNVTEPSRSDESSNSDQTASE
jgi:predicted PurR-regulated permease PerM